ncbi:hypothetical protein GCM10027406_32200 [Leifsonia lichenia]
MVDHVQFAQYPPRSPSLLGVLGLSFSLQSAAGLVLLWAVVWLPVYLFRNMYVLFLYPVVFVVWAGCMGLALIGLILSLFSFGQPHARARGAGWAVGGVVTSLFLLCTSWAAFVFGGAPLGSIGEL